MTTISNNFMSTTERQVISILLILLLATLAGGFLAITGYILVNRCRYKNSKMTKKEEFNSRHDITIRINNSFNETLFAETTINPAMLEDLEFFEIKSDIDSIDYSYEGAKERAETTIKSNVFGQRIQSQNGFFTIQAKKKGGIRAKRNLLAEFNAHSGENFSNRYQPKRVFSSSFFEV